MQPTDDSALLREYAENHSDDAFAALVARHVNLVYSVALRHIGNPHHAEEITQAVFIILAKKAASLRHEKALSSWLFQTTRLTANNFVRSEIRRHRREEEASMQSVLEGGRGASPHQTQEIWSSIAPMLDSAVAGLREQDRRAIVLRFYEGRNLREVGLALGASEDAAEKRVSRALEKLRNFFSKKGVSSTAATIGGAIAANSVQAAPVALTKTVTAAAIAKGAAASGSILTLVKGALKIMAWTKAKTAMVAGVVILLAAGTTHVMIKEIRSPRAGPRTTPATESIKGQLVGRSELVDAGNTTPEAAWESRYWARAIGDYDAVIAATEPQAVPTAKAWMGDKATFRKRSPAEFASFKGIQILARKDLASDRVELKYQFAFEDGPDSLQTKIVQMAKVNGVWRCAETRAYDASWDEGSQPEPQP